MYTTYLCICWYNNKNNKNNNNNNKQGRPKNILRIKRNLWSWPLKDGVAPQFIQKRPTKGTYVTFHPIFHNGFYTFVFRTGGLAFRKPVVTKHGAAYMQKWYFVNWLQCRNWRLRQRQQYQHHNSDFQRDYVLWMQVTSEAQRLQKREIGFQKPYIFYRIQSL